MARPDTRKKRLETVLPRLKKSPEATDPYMRGILLTAIPYRQVNGLTYLEIG